MKTKRTGQAFAIAAPAACAGETLAADHYPDVKYGDRVSVRVRIDALIDHMLKFQAR